MAEMGIAHIAGGFNARHAIRSVLVVPDHIFRNGLCEGRPSGTALELRTGIEQFGLAANAPIDSGFKERAGFRTECAFGTLKSGYAELLTGEDRFPFRFGFLHTPWWYWVSMVSIGVHVDPIHVRSGMIIEEK